MTRSKLETLYDILTLLRQKPQRISWLMQKANVNFHGAAHFLGYLMQQMYVDKRGNLYLLTPQGRRFYHELKPWGTLEKDLRNHTS